MLEVDVVEECKLGGLGGGDGGFLEVDVVEECKLGGLGDGDGGFFDMGYDGITR